MAKPTTSVTLNTGHSVGDGVAYFLLNENTGTGLHNYIANPAQVDGAMATGASWTTNDSAEPAVDCDGATGYFNLNGLTENNLRQVGSMVIRFQMAEADKTDSVLKGIIGIGDANSNSNIIELRKITDNTLVLRYREGNPTPATNHDLSLGACSTVLSSGWHQVALAWDVGAGGTDTLYAWVDDGAVQTADMTGVASIATGYLDQLHVGKTAQGTTGSSETDMQVDFVYVFDYVLLDAQVATLYSTPYAMFSGAGGSKAYVKQFTTFSPDGGPIAAPWASTAGKAAPTTAPGSAPTIVSPSDTATGVALAVTLQFSDVATATYYEVQVATANTFLPQNLVLSVSNLGTSEYAAALPQNLTTYYWRARGLNDGGPGPWMTTASFTTIIALADVPILLSPGNDEVGVDTDVLLQWSAAPRAATYKIQLDTSADFSGAPNIVDVTGEAGPTYVVSTVLAEATTHYWRVLSTNAAGDSQWSPTQQFYTMQTVVAPTLVSPADAATQQEVALLGFFWDEVPNTLYYHWQLDTAATFDSQAGDPYSEDATLTTTFKFEPNITVNTTYYWRVRASADGDTYGDWSSTRSFTTTTFAVRTTGVGQVITRQHLAGGGVYADGILVQHNNCTVTFCEAYNFTGKGIQVAAGVTGTKIYHCCLYGNDYGIYMLASTTLQNNALSTNTTADLYIDAGQTVTMAYNVVNSALVDVSGSGSVSEGGL